jgi:hypothetical protein
VIWAANRAGPFTLVVIDTLAQVSAGADENSGKDMSVVLRHCRAVREHTGAMVLLVHHSGKDSTKGARGWSGIKGALDVEIEVARAGRLRSATVSKLKDGSDGKEYAFELRTVEVGKDEDGDPITSCVVEYTHGSVAQAKALEPRGKWGRQAIDSTVELVGISGAPVDEETVVANMLAAQGTSPEDRHARRSARRALREEARKAESISTEGGRVHLVRGPE